MSRPDTFFPVTIALKWTTESGAIRPYISLGTGIYYGVVIDYYACKKSGMAFPNKVEKETTMTGISLGVNSSIGVEFRLSDNFSLFTEGRFDFLDFMPMTTEVTKYIQDDIDITSQLNPNQKHPMPSTFWPITANCFSIRGGLILYL